MEVSPYTHGIGCALAALIILWGGCATPAEYRREADCEVSHLLRQQGSDEQWYLSETSVEVPPQSRNFDPYARDCPPMPPDDPAAHRIMHCPGDQPGYKHWHSNGDAARVESTAWRDYLVTNDQGELELSSERSYELALLNNRDFQFQLENVYLTALQLTLQEFEFDLQWFGGNTTEYRNGGNDSLIGNRDEIGTLSFLGFNRNFAAGGQLLVNFANSFVWEFTGSKSNLATSNLAVEFVQPLLRGAYRDVRLEGLTQSERNVLYAVRDFARFRKQFYVNTVSGDQGYLDLLLKLQAIRNLEQNLEALEQNLRTHEALAEAGIVTPLQVDQVFQSYQGGRLSLIRARNNLQNSLDSYKIQLGMPPELPVTLDDSQLDRFEFTSPQVMELELRINELLDHVRRSEADLDAAAMKEITGVLQQQMKGTVAEIESVDVELQRWEREGQEKPAATTDVYEREARDRRTMRQRLNELRRGAMRLYDEIETVQLGVDPESQTRLELLVRTASNQISDLFVIQTQIRTYLIELQTIEVSEPVATNLALSRRLDLKNERAMVVDSWRKIRVAQDGLEADLNLFSEADIATQPRSTNPVDFSSDATSYRVGVALDGPLNRLAERNIYRAELINYQRSRRDLIGLRDSIVQAVRRDLRALEAEQLNFEISRQSLVAAARQVELARLELLSPDQKGDSSTTQDALNALNSLLAAKNSLIASWVSYETARYQLLLDIESLDLDQYGQIGEDDRVSDTSAGEAGQRELVVAGGPPRAPPPRGRHGRR